MRRIALFALLIALTLFELFLGTAFLPMSWQHALNDRIATLLPRSGDLTPTTHPLLGAEIEQVRASRIKILSLCCSARIVTLEFIRHSIRLAPLSWRYSLPHRLIYYAPNWVHSKEGDQPSFLGGASCIAIGYSSDFYWLCRQRSRKRRRLIRKRCRRCCRRFDNYGNSCKARMRPPNERRSSSSGFKRSKDWSSAHRSVPKRLGTSLPRYKTSAKERKVSPSQRKTAWSIQNPAMIARAWKIKLHSISSASRNSLAKSNNARPSSLTPKNSCASSRPSLTNSTPSWINWTRPYRKPPQNPTEARGPGHPVLRSLQGSILNSRICASLLENIGAGY